MELSGEPPRVGDDAPQFELINNDMESVTLSDSQGKVRILSVVPSIDTPVCEMQTRRFNQELEKLGDQVVAYTISVDTPFAQKRWCGMSGVEKMQLLSDYKGNKFGEDWGLYIPELGLLARSVFIVDENGKVTYSQIVPEIAQEPNYDEVLDQVKR